LEFLACERRNGVTAFGAGNVVFHGQNFWPAFAWIEARAGLLKQSTLRAVRRTLAPGTTSARDFRPSPWLAPVIRAERPVRL